MTYVKMLRIIRFKFSTHHNGKILIQISIFTSFAELKLGSTQNTDVSLKKLHNADELYFISNSDWIIQLYYF